MSKTLINGKYRSVDPVLDGIDKIRVSINDIMLDLCYHNIPKKYRYLTLEDIRNIKILSDLMYNDSWEKATDFWYENFSNSEILPKVVDKFFDKLSGELVCIS